MLDTVQIIQNIIYLFSLYYVVFWLLVLLEKKEEKKPGLKLSQYPEVSIAIPAYNEEDNIVETLECVAALDYPEEKLSIILMDDGSTDKTYVLAQECTKKLKKKHDFRKFIVLTQKNQGKFMAMNNALKHINTPFFATLDADSLPKADALKKIMACFEEDIAAVSPILKVYKPKNLLQKMQLFEYSVNHFYKSLIARLNAIHVTPGPLSVYRTDVIKEIGGFRKAHHTEDMEVALRIHKKHYRIVQCNEAFVYTKVPSELRSLYRQRHRWNYGTFRNILDYRSMLFKWKYGDFGFFQMPIILVSGLLGVATLGLIIHAIWKSFRPSFDLLRLYNFDLIKYFSNTKLNIIWLDIDMRTTITVLGFFLLSLFVLSLSLRLYKNKLVFKKSAALITYIFLYYLLLAVIWVGVYMSLLFSKGTSWKR